MNNDKRMLKIREQLQAALNPTHLEIEDESHLHRGHVGAQSGAGHFAVTLASPFFIDKTKIACHRLIYAALGSMMPTEIHALKIKVIDAL